MSRHWQQHEETGHVHHRLEGLVFALVLLAVPTMIVVQTHNPVLHNLGIALNWIIWATFLAELAFRLIVAPNTMKALRAHWLEAVIVVLAVPAAARLFANTALVRAFQLALFGARGIQAEGVLTSRKGVKHALVITVLVVVFAGTAVAIVNAGEFSNPFIGIWWALTTVTTVGYGDYSPHNDSGRVIGMAVMLLGVVLIPILSASLTSRFQAQETEEAERARKNEHQELLDAISQLNGRLDEIEQKIVG